MSFDTPRIFLGSSGKQQKLLQALMRGDNPFRSNEPASPRMTAPGSRQDEAQRGSDKRTDSGVDLGGPVPAPA